MFSLFKRKTGFHISKFHRDLSYPVVVAFFLGCIVSWLSAIYFLVEDHHTYRPQLTTTGLLSLAILTLVLIIFWILRVSARYFGIHERMAGHLDQVVSGRLNTPLKTRKDDVAFKEFLGDINTLIERTQN